MNYPLDLHPLDRRSHKEKLDNLINLNVIQDVLEDTIGSYVLQNPENIYDEEFGIIIRKLEFSRGLKTHQIILGPDGFVRWISKKFSSTLLQDIHNALLGIEIFEEDQT